MGSTDSGKNGAMHASKIVFPLCFGIFDMRGGKQLCGMYDSSNGMRQCISCYKRKDALDNITNEC